MAQLVKLLFFFLNIKILFLTSSGLQKQETLVAFYLLSICFASLYKTTREKISLGDYKCVISICRFMVFLINFRLSPVLLIKRKDV